MSERFRKNVRVAASRKIRSFDSLSPSRAFRFFIGESVLLVLLVAVIEGAARGGVALGAVPSEELRMTAPPVVRPHPLLGFCLREASVRQPGSPVEQRINRRGYRGKAFGPKTPESFRVICVGDSVIYGDSLGEEDTIPAVLEKLLQYRLPDRKVEVLNAGVLQYTSAESFAALALRGLDFSPDVV